MSVKRPGWKRIERIRGSVLKAREARSAEGTCEQRPAGSEARTHGLGEGGCRCREQPVQRPGGGHSVRLRNEEEAGVAEAVGRGGDRR